jgi:hypothetical protein
MGNGDIRAAKSVARQPLEKTLELRPLDGRFHVSAVYAIRLKPIAMYRGR